MNRYAGIALTCSAVFLIVMAILVNSPSLFYMATAIIITIAAARIQARLAVRYLRFERYTTPAVQVGDEVTVEIVVKSERKLKRPLVQILDLLPPRLVTLDLTPSLPVAPSFDQPIKTRYSFRPMRRGTYRWERLSVRATDALGLVRAHLIYKTDPVELVVYPVPLPIHSEIHPLIGWGASDLDSGKSQGSGLEPRGIREYVYGDPLRYVHWRSSARRPGKLMVKEFETGSGVMIKIILQTTEGTEIGGVETTTFEHMCSHSLFLASEFLEKGATVVFPVQESANVNSEHPEARLRSVRELLTEIRPNSNSSLATDVLAVKAASQEGETIVIFMAVADMQLPTAILGWNGVNVICMCYDPYEFLDSTVSLKSISSAASPDYIGKLESAGAQVIVLPRHERLGS